MLWQEQRCTWVVELKCSYKYEPLGLAEVLHHAHMLAAHGEVTKPIIPVVVSSYAPWLRGATRWIADVGANSLQTLEVDLLDKGRVIWFDAPLAPWKAAKRPAALELPAEYGDGWHWFLVAETGTWIATRTTETVRPIVIADPYVMVAPLRRAAAATGEFVLWQGRPPPKLSRKSKQDWNSSEYWLWNPEVAASGKQPRPPR